MAWATVRNEEESYLYTYLRSGTGTTGKYPPVLPVPRVPTITVNLLEILWENSLPVLPDFHRYHRSRPVLPVHPLVLPLVHFTSKKSSVGIWPTGTTGLSPVPPVKTGTTDPPTVLPLVQKLAELSTATGGIYTYRYYRLFTGTTGAPRHKTPQCPWVQRCLSNA
jgi:hypothetical protein